MKKELSKLVTISLLFILFVGCSSILLDEDEANTNENNFQILWEEFDEHYASFITKGINWDSLYTVYQPQAVQATDEGALFSVCTRLLDELDDSHVGIDGPGMYHTSNFNKEIEAADQFDLSLVEGYLQSGSNNVHFSPYSTGFVYGKIGDDIGYIFIVGFDDDDESGWEDSIDKVLAQLAECKSLIVDIRINPGGTDEVAHRIASAFCSKPVHAYSVQTKSGPAHDAFDTPTPHYLSPGKVTFTKPVVLLTNKFVISAAEVFALLMNSQPHVTQIGDTTSGAFSDVSNTKFLPNGWSFSLSHQLYTYPNGTSPEGVGEVPDIYIVNPNLYIKENMNTRKDLVLERAIDFLRSRID